MTPFERFGIKHLSPSSLNLFQASPVLWAGRYLFKWQDDAGPAAKRGGAVEAGLDVFLWERDQEKAKRAALDNFALNTGGVVDDAHEKERAVIPPMLNHAIAALESTPTPLARQIKVECWLDGVDLPVIGYVDYSYDAFDQDLKTTHAIPSVLKGEHARQVSLYWRARKKPARILYVSKSKYSILGLDPEEAELHLIDMTRAARCLQHALSKVDTAQDFCRFYSPDFDNFRWSAQTRKLAADIYAPL